MKVHLENWESSFGKFGNFIRKLPPKKTVHNGKKTFCHYASLVSSSNRFFVSDGTCQTADIETAMLSKNYEKKDGRR